MALRALTPGKAAYCSDCGAGTLPDAGSCGKCGAAFEGFMDAVLCPICNSVNPAEARECRKCSARFPEIQTVEVPPKPAEGSPEEEYLRNILRLSREKAKARLSQTPSSPSSAAEPASMTEGDRDQSEFEAYLWKLAEPFDKMMDRRKQRLEQMDALIERARTRIRALEASTTEIEVREREELKRQIEELLLEKEDILKIEEGLVDMENTYRNILRMQQDELKAKESTLRARIEAFRAELEKRERTFGQMRERESDIVRREDEFRMLMNRLHEREREMDKREELLRDKARLLDERHHALSEAEVDMERRRWSLEQKASGEGPAARGGQTMITVAPEAQELTDLKARMTQMEEQFEQLQAEKAELAGAQKSLLEFQETIKTVMRDLDALLGELPDEKIRRFAKSDRFAVYEKIMDQLEL